MGVVYDRPYHPPVLFYVIYGVARRLLRAFVGRPCVCALEIENAVLRHQLAVLRRKAGRPRFRRMDRVLIAAASRMLPGTDGPPSS